MAQKHVTTETAEAKAAAKLEEDIAYLAKRLRVSPAVVREIVRRVGSSERAAVQREIERGNKAKR